MHRRDILKALAAASVGAVLPRPRNARATTHHADDRPRYYVFVFLEGGQDSVYTADPRTKSEVAAGIDVPFGPDAIMSFGQMRIGPNLALMGETAKELAIIKGVHTNVLNHISGERQFLRLKIGASSRMPTIASILASQRDTQAVAELYLPLGGRDTFVPGFIGSTPSDGDDATDFFDALDATSPDDLHRLAKIYRGHADRLGGSGAGLEQLGTAANVKESARLFERAAETPPFKPEDWGKKSIVSKSLQRALWVLENDLACSVFVTFPGWDTHIRNDSLQTQRGASLYPVLGRFMEALRSRKNRFGPLIDNTVVFIGSELGRFPRLNQMLGKDHFPEAPYFLAGKGLKPGSYGATGKEMEGLPISAETGRAKAGGAQPTLNDLASTLLLQSGLNPVAYGYTGRELKFLFAKG